jgi:hypothetical protein
LLQSRSRQNGAPNRTDGNVIPRCDGGGVGPPSL